MQNRAFLNFDVFSTTDRESELWDTLSLWRNHIEKYGDTIKKEGGAFIDELFITIIKTLMEKKKKSDLWMYGRLNPNLDRSKEALPVFSALHGPFLEFMGPALTEFSPVENLGQQRRRG